MFIHAKNLFATVCECSVDNEHDSVKDGQPSLGHAGVDVGWFQRESTVIVVGHHSGRDVEGGADQHVEHIQSSTDRCSREQPNEYTR